MLELQSSIGGGEAPPHRRRGLISGRLPGGHLTREGLNIRKAPIRAESESESPAGSASENANRAW